MRVFDFDGTIYSGDSTYDFYFYLISIKPKVLLYLPRFIKSFIQYKLNIPIKNIKNRIDLSDETFRVLNKTYLKQDFFKFLNAIDRDEIDIIIKKYWNRQLSKNKIFKYYLKKRSNDNVIISASPRFLLAPIIEKLGGTLICSEVDKHTGKYNSLSCWWIEKVHRYMNIYKNAPIDEFYSDSIDDLPLALMSKKPYRVLRNGNVIKWNF